MKVLIDTNVVMDALINREPWADAAQEILRAVAMEKIKGYIIASQTTDIFYLLCRQGADKATAKGIIETLMGSMMVMGVIPDDVNNALASDMLDYEDGLLACCAKRQKAEYIVTRNEKDFKESPVPAISPQTFLERFFPA